MFVGHYGVSFLVRSREPELPLWLLFICVQLVDILFAIFVLFGIEHVRIVPGITATNPLDLYDLPYTHSLIGSLGWSTLMFLVLRFIGGYDNRASVWGGIAVFSHWVLDLIVHRPDLSLFGDGIKVGLGLWNYPMIAIALEAGLLFTGIVIYVAYAAKSKRYSQIAYPIFGVILLAMQASMLFAPPPGSINVLAISGLITYLMLVVIAYVLERFEIRYNG